MVRTRMQCVWRLRASTALRLSTGAGSIIATQACIDMELIGGMFQGSANDSFQMLSSYSRGGGLCSYILVKDGALLPPVVSAVATTASGSTYCPNPSRSKFEPRLIMILGTFWDIPRTLEHALSGEAAVQARGGAEL
jgi:hypothetical protein